ncbi:uncharacterized protein B0P05DRAFT_558236 [Gilbertella persicaria]|uniref:uncharacterized protein n=1 Tax=Gilbertella persicaria TaxID=101096 RepID=UPI00222095B7|nr:uncharacterized protein B0P05DRAFT_558236 [Gilbertella persicaria]KAI8059968.1 hypothetical protein B0P05DRAFT_558236 [Gilbertella persicaria]
MNFKLLIALSSVIALIHAQNLDSPALSSLSSKIESIATSVTGDNRTPLLSSASSAYSRISSALARSAATATSSVTSAQSSASSTQQSASSALSSSGSTGSATASNTQGATNAASALDFSNTLTVQILALAALFIVSFVAMLA